MTGSQKNSLVARYVPATTASLSLMLIRSPTLSGRFAVALQRAASSPPARR